ncbi:hypothetical protein C8F01DRAFT_1046997 [Mycena amicta]|nr:hypothetical protein C8F01DRAFT_1046997 [Mycena amicta]
MPSPPVEVFLTTIASQAALRQRQEYILRILQVKKIPFTSYDLASDETAKRRWRRKAPADKQQIPGILVGGKYPGDFADFEEAVECGELDTFLRLKETWDADIDGDGATSAPVQPIGVPGAFSPLEMTPEHVRTQVIAEYKASPLKNKGVPLNKRDDLFDLSTELSGYGLQGVQVSEQELLDLVAELGLDGDEADDLVKGLSNAKTEEPVEAEEVAKEVVAQQTPDDLTVVSKPTEELKAEEPANVEPETEPAPASTEGSSKD